MSLRRAGWWHFRHLRKDFLGLLGGLFSGLQSLDARLRLPQPPLPPLIRCPKDSCERTPSQGPRSVFPVLSAPSSLSAPDKSPKWTRPASTSAGYTCSGFVPSKLYRSGNLSKESAGIMTSWGGWRKNEDSGHWQS